ncbi:hypothetical protein CJD36_022535 [Flavipsychrobacter stenotrophus]|uniref:Uncharacterized protein n=1 Tax=Flavipsychrobacter stenotrophus TaxID=2077091 RepID=A0A2S7SPY4_9BACT|nr:hypothetical protein [Flavipsychrobacter stenotrophus]PQJ08778.1 hypothetical protein CJD36_022535 [Flavipsychrobacter stenotrophus]
MDVKKPTKRMSKRLYAGIPCKKADCNKIFQPTDSRQKYCCPQHRVDHNNDKRKANDTDAVALLKTLKHNDAVLAKVFRSEIYSMTKGVSLDLLQYERFEFDYFVKRQKNTQTGKTVLWMFKYGIEPTEFNNNIFLIRQSA